METCGTCSHVQALHAGRTGHCRLNGCRCGEFAVRREPVPVATAIVVPAATFRGVSVEAFTAILTAIGFVAGLLLGLSL